MTTPLDRLSLDDLRERTSIKWQAFGPDVLPLWVAEMDVTLAEPIIETLMRAVARGDTGYPVPGRYAEAMAEFAAERWGWTIEPEHTSDVADVMTGIAEVLRVTTARGGAVVVNSPVYTPFYDVITSTGREPVESPLTADHRLDVEGLEQTFARLRRDGRSTAYLLCNPHNPTGTVHTRNDLTAALELAARYDVRVVADEIHGPIVYPGASYVPLLTLEGGERAFVVVSASKAWNLAGLKAALAVAGAEALDDLAAFPPDVTHGPSHFGLIAHTAALRHGGGWLDDLLVGLDRNRLLLADLLAEHLPTIRYRPPQGTCLAWLDCRALGLGDEPAQRFLERGVALSAGHEFGTGGAGHVRLNLATSTDILTAAVRRMAAQT